MKMLDDVFFYPKTFFKSHSRKICSGCMKMFKLSKHFSWRSSTRQ
eukprot:UN19850